MSEPARIVELSMRDGTPFRVQLCVEPGTPHSPEFLRGQIAEAFGRLSTRSRWQRFSAPVHRLSDRQLDYLTDIDNRDRVAWCASASRGSQRIGIGLARYIRLHDEPDVAEFALTVVVAVAFAVFGGTQAAIAAAFGGAIALANGWLSGRIVLRATQAARTNPGSETMVLKRRSIGSFLESRKICSPVPA